MSMGLCKGVPAVALVDMHEDAEGELTAGCVLDKVKTWESLKL